MAIITSNSEKLNKFILDCDFCKAEKYLRDKTESEQSFALSLGIVCLIRSIVSCSIIDFNLAILQLNDVHNKATVSCKATTSKLYPMASLLKVKSLQLFDDLRFTSNVETEKYDAKREEFNKLYYNRAVSDLIASECVLLKMLLKCIFNGVHSNIFAEIMKESELIQIRAAYLTLYHSYERFDQLPRGNALREDVEYRDQLMFSWGLCSLLTLLLPRQLGIIIGTSGFQLPTVAEALKVIEEAISGTGIHSLLAILILLMHHIEVKSEDRTIKKYLDLLAHPNTVLPQLFKAKKIRLKGQTTVAIDILSRIRISPSSSQLPVYWEMIQCFAESQKWPESIQFIKYLRDSGQAFPSKIFSLYLEASFMQASTGRTFGPLSVEVQILLRKVLEASRAKHQDPRPLLDQLSINRARNVLERNEQFFIPHFELILLWNRLENVMDKEFIINQIKKSLESSGQRQLTPEQQALGWLILAVLSDSSKAAIKLISNHIIKSERTLPPANFVSILSKCELAYRQAIEGNDERASSLLEEIEMLCFDKNGFPGQATILVLISKLKHQLLIN